MPFTIERNDLCSVEADAIVVAANEQLQITGGVGMKVAQAAGFNELQDACNKIGYCPCGSAVATPAFNLRAKVVVHAVGPIWNGGNHGEAALLRSAYDAALECAVDAGATSVALPLISAGTYGFPADISLAVARESIRAFINEHEDVDVRLVLYSRDSVRAGMAAYLDIAEYIDDNYVEDHPEWHRQAQCAPAAAPQSSGPFAREAMRGPALGPRERSEGGSRDGLASRIARVLGGARDKRAAQRAPEDMEEAAPAPTMDAAAAAPMPKMGAGAPTRSLQDFLDSMDAPFSTTLLALIDERGLNDAQVYKRANMSRQLFSKIRSTADYRPTKKTVLALAVALELDLTETSDLLSRAGYALSNSSKADVIVKYFISGRNYDIFEINEALYAFDQPIL